jgi:hypothetical protein
MKKTLLALLMSTTAMLAANSVSAASIKYDGSGNILGVNGINIGGTSYDATFSNTFNGTTYDLGFSTAASTALLNEFSYFNANGVFSGTTTDLYHDTRIVGFEAYTPAKFTFKLFNRFFTPSQYLTQANGALHFVNGISVYNNVFATVPKQNTDIVADLLGLIDVDAIETSSYQINADGKLKVESIDPYNTFVQWKESVSPVPVPAAAYLFAPALMGFVALRRKATKA